MVTNPRWLSADSAGEVDGHLTGWLYGWVTSAALSMDGLNSAVSQIVSMIGVGIEAVVTVG